MKNDNQTMDRAIPVSEQRRRKLRRTAVAVAIAVAVLGAGAWLGTQMIPTLDRKALIISEVDRGTIDVSVSATGRIVTSARPYSDSTYSQPRPTTPRLSTSARYAISKPPN